MLIWLPTDGSATVGRMAKETAEARRARILKELQRREARSCNSQVELMPQPPQRVFHWGAKDQERQLLDSTLQTPDVAFMVKVAALCSLPRTNPGSRDRYIRANGDWQLTLTAGGPDKRLPYGNVPRLLLAWMCREAVQTRQPRLILGRSLKDFMGELGMQSNSGGPRSDRTRLQNQMERLFCTSIELISTEKHRLHRVADHVTTHTDLWWSTRRPDEPVLFDSSVTLGQAFFNEILRSPVPVDMTLLKALRRSTLGLDLYFWLTCRYFTLAEPIELRWEQLYVQFGAQPNRPTRIAVQNFRADAIRELKKIKLAWPQIRYSLPYGGLLLMPTKPRIAPTKAPPLRA